MDRFVPLHARTAELSADVRDDGLALWLSIEHGLVANAL
jgi:hypothetical protein